MSNLSKIVIFDIDGTLSDATHRLHHLYPAEGEKKNWSAFFAKAKEDKPIVPIINLNYMYHKNGYHIILCTGRPANTRNDTIDWLNKHSIKYDVLLMRLTADRGPDYEVKPKTLLEYLEGIGKAFSDIEIIFEDRLRVCQAWKKLGIPVAVVGEEAWEQR